MSTLAGENKHKKQIQDVMHKSEFETPHDKAKVTLNKANLVYCVNINCVVCKSNLIKHLNVIIHHC